MQNNKKDSIIMINMIAISPSVVTIIYFNQMYHNDIKLSSIYASIISIIIGLICSIVYVCKKYKDEYQKIIYLNAIKFFMICYIAPRINEILKDVYYTDARSHYFDILPVLIILVTYLYLARIDIKLPQNKYSIIANKITLQDEEIWDKVQKLTLTYTYYVCIGIISYLIIFSDFFIFDTYEVVKIIILISTCLIVPHIYSVRLYKIKYGKTHL